MSKQKHDHANQSHSHSDHAHHGRPFWKHAHRDWRVRIVVVLMIALILIYVITDNLSLTPDDRTRPSIPAANQP